MRTPLFKAMGPAIARAMINDRAPRSIRPRRIDLRGGRSGRRLLLHDRRLGEALSPSRRGRGNRRGDLFRRRDLCRGRDVSRRALSRELRGGVAARILKIDATKLRQAVLDQPQLAFDMLAAASVRLRQLVDEIEQLKAKSAPQRIAGFFVKQALLASGPARIALPYEKALIASRLGMKPESFSRAVGKLAELGVVVERESVSIGDVARLAAFAEGHG